MAQRQRLPDAVVQVCSDLSSFAFLGGHQFGGESTELLLIANKFPVGRL